MTRTMIALYDDLDDARATVEALVENGFDRASISLCRRDPRAEEPLVEHEAVSEHVVESAERGALVGGAAGLLAGVASLFIPGVGAAIAVGPLVSALTGTAVGAGAGALVGSLVGMGVDEGEADSYAEAVRRGGTLVAVRVADERWAEADDILEQRHPVDIGMRAADWRAQGWVRFDPDAKPFPLPETRSRREQ